MKKFILSENEMPRQWYNILPDLPTPLPPYLNPVTHQPLQAADLAALLPQAVIEQEFSQERWTVPPLAHAHLGRGRVCWSLRANRIGPHRTPSPPATPRTGFTC